MPKSPFTLFSRGSGVVRDLEHATSLGLPVLGAIRVHGTEANSSLPDENSPDALDAYRRLVDLIRVPDSHVRGRAIVVTSAESGGEKSSVALNLATLLARGGSKVVLVEADLRMAARRKVGDGTLSSGFSGLLVNQLRTASSAVVHTMEPKLKLLPVGSVTGIPTTLLRSPRLPLVVDQLRTLADHVIFEVPSVLAWDEGLHLVHLADMTLLVVETGKTSRSAARHAAAKLKEATLGTLGVVLDRAPAWVAALGVPLEPPVEIRTVRPSPVVMDALEAPAEASHHRLELAVGELLADLEDALTLIRSIRRRSSDAETTPPDEGPVLVAIPKRRESNSAV
jgi:Mrp family chromosome partitioning ATPase